MHLVPRIIRIILLSAFLATGCSIQAQINFMDGWIITPQNDTLRGFIKDCGEIRASKICLFRETRDSRTVNYGPRDIDAYQIKGGSYYVNSDYSLKGDSAPSFSTVLLEGELSLYLNRKNRRMAYYIQKQESDPVVLINKEVIVQRESNLLFYGNSNTNSFMVPVYRDSLRSLFQESKKIQNQVENVGYNQESLINITKAYLRETCDTDDCITYEKDISINRNRLGFYTGVQYSQIRSLEGSWESDFQSTIPIGALYNIPLRLINDRLSFQLEILYRRLKYDEIKSSDGEVLDNDIILNLIGLPLSLNYEFSKKKFSPTIAVGNEPGIYIIRDSNYPMGGIQAGELRAYLSRGGHWFIDAGMNYDINPDFTLFANFRLSGYPFASGQSKIYIISNKANFHSTFIALHLGVKF